MVGLSYHHHQAQEVPRLIPPEDTERLIEIQPAALVGDTGTTAVIPRLPVDWTGLGRALQALQRGRGIAPPHDLLRGRLAYVLGPLSTRRLGAWAVLSGLADSSEAAWRKRLRGSNEWLGWLLSELVATPETPVPSIPSLAGRRLLVAASCLPPPGGTGDDWRRHLAYDFLAGRMSQGQVTDRRGGERLDRYRWPAGAVIVADNGDGYRRSVAWAVQQRADIVGRLPPATLPLETDTGQPCNVLRWLRQGGTPARAWGGWCRGAGQRYHVRLLAAKLAAPAPQRARRRKHRQAQQAGRTITAPTLAGAGWVLLSTTLEAPRWSAADVLSVYRVRWPVEVGLKKHAATAATPPETPQAHYQCGSYRAGLTHCLGVA
ncbi:MAG TPA: hypothetical protein VIH59_20550 [Candidatus Tectomicrobia bacterium]